jgi:hypothetical protein
VLVLILILSARHSQTFHKMMERSCPVTARQTGDATYAAARMGHVLSEFWAASICQPF